MHGHWGSRLMPFSLEENPGRDALMGALEELLPFSLGENPGGRALMGCLEDFPRPRPSSEAVIKSKQYAAS